MACISAEWDAIGLSSPLISEPESSRGVRVEACCLARTCVPWTKPDPTERLGCQPVVSVNLYM